MTVNVHKYKSNLKHSCTFMIICVFINVNDHELFVNTELLLALSS